MTSRFLGTCLAIACGCVPAGAADEGRQPPPQPPFYRLREHQAEYAGPGRDEPPPQDVDEVLLGYFGPGDPAHPDGGDLWLAAQMAVDEANRRGGCQGKPFRIVARWSENPWGTGVAEVARMVYDENVWAIVGGIDGPSTHLAEQVVAKARLPLVSPASSDKTVNLANVPWMFSLLPGDHLQAPVLAAAVSDRVGSRAFVLISAVDHDSRLFTTELRKCLTSRRLLPRYHFEHNGAREDEPRLVDRIVESKPDAVVLVAGAHQSARLVVGLRRRGFAGLVFGSAAMGRRRFHEEAGEAAEGVLFPLLYRTPTAPAEEPPKEFFDAFEKRYGHAPDYAAAHTYDAFRLLVAAIRTAGLNRARIRDALRDLSPYSGVAGTVAWDPQGSNTRAVSLGTIRDGRVIPVQDRGPLVPRLRLGTH
ncbi:MAG TPA: ABC transporter substrate-binding protein [Thermoguttaceae bacterium]|nr:ABC transporter substrate-binding protein [Thermoguttaceae bacterium]